MTWRGLIITTLTGSIGVGIAVWISTGDIWRTLGGFGGGAISGSVVYLWARKRLDWY